MHYRIQICHSGTYTLWMLMKFDDTDTDFVRYYWMVRTWMIRYVSKMGFFYI